MHIFTVPKVLRAEAHQINKLDSLNGKAAHG